MNDVTFPCPKNPSYVDWSLHYPAFYGIKDNRGDAKFCNTKDFPIDYSKQCERKPSDKVPSILDIGCGYGGLLFALSEHFPDKLALGVEIRDKVTNFVAEKIGAVRINSGYTKCLNAAVVRSNTMKTLQHYFEKESIEKMFFCFADPHFKKVNHRRRIINTDLISDYAYCLKEEGQIYIVTDVKDLFDWEYSHLKAHPLFEEIPKEETAVDPCVKFMSEDTDEARKVIRNGGEIWHAVFRKVVAKRSSQQITKSLLKTFL